MLRGCRCNIIVLNVHVPCEDESDDIKDSFYGELRHVFYQFPRYNMNILLDDFNARVGRQDIFRPAIGNESLYEINNYIGVRVVNFATSKNLVVASIMMPHFNIHKYAWTSPEGKVDSQIDHVWIDRRQYSSILNVQY
jgi:hypothetical protein